MSEKVLAKVDYIKPLDDIAYHEVIKEKEVYNSELKLKLEDIAGKGNVFDDRDILMKYSRDKSLEEAGSPTFVVFPKDTQGLCTILEFANEKTLPVIPVSSGTHNWGAALPRMGGIVVDLSRWNNIQKIDKRNRAVRIEPGVTYGQLQDALKDEGLRALTPLLPRKDQSVLTAHIEAHPMTIPEFNYSEPVYTAEIVMPEGKIFRTGTASLGSPADAGSDLIGPWGPGFDWNRLYTRAQGTLGIVTWVNIMAEPLPVKEKYFFTEFADIDSLVSFTYMLQRRWLGYECFGLNRTALALMLSDRPPYTYQSLKRVLPEYVQIFCIAGLKRFPEERIKWQEADFFDTARTCGVNTEQTLCGAPRAEAFFRKNLKRPWSGDVYWKDALKGSSAEIFFITTMDRASSFITAMKDEAVNYYYNYNDIGIYLQPIENARAVHLEFIIPYNPEDEYECRQVKNFHRSASLRMHSMGGLYTRAYGSWAQMNAKSSAVQHQTSKTIKETLDPNNIMNPGRFGL